MGQTIPQSVGDTWTEILYQAGADERIAANLPKLIASHPRLTNDTFDLERSTSSDVVVETVEKILDEIDFSDKGIEEPHDVQERMVHTLRLAQSTENQREDAFELDDATDLKEIEITGDVDRVTINQVSEINEIDRDGDLEFTNLKENEVLKLVEPLAEKLIEKDVAKPHFSIDSSEDDKLFDETQEKKNTNFQESLELLQEEDDPSEDGDMVGPERAEIIERVDTRLESFLYEFFSNTISNLTGESTQIFFVGINEDMCPQEDRLMSEVKISDPDTSPFATEEASTWFSTSNWLSNDLGFQFTDRWEEDWSILFPISEFDNDEHQVTLTFYKHGEKNSEKGFLDTAKLAKNMFHLAEVIGYYQNQNLPCQERDYIDQSRCIRYPTDLLKSAIKQKASDAAKEKTSAVDQFFNFIMDSVNSKVNQPPSVRLLQADNRLFGSDSPKNVHYYPQLFTRLDRRNFTEQLVDREQQLQFWMQSLLFLIAVKHDPHIQKGYLEKPDNSEIDIQIQENLHRHFEFEQRALLEDFYHHQTTVPIRRKDQPESEWIDTKLLNHQNISLESLFQWITRLERLNIDTSGEPFRFSNPQSLLPADQPLLQREYRSLIS